MLQKRLIAMASTVYQLNMLKHQPLTWGNRWQNFQRKSTQNEILVCLEWVHLKAQFQEHQGNSLKIQLKSIDKYISTSQLTGFLKKICDLCAKWDCCITYSCNFFKKSAISNVVLFTSVFENLLVGDKQLASPRMQNNLAPVLVMVFFPWKDFSLLNTDIVLRVLQWPLHKVSSDNNLEYIYLEYIPVYIFALVWCYIYISTAQPLLSVTWLSRTLD